MITYMFFCILMNLRTFSCIVLFSLCIRTNNIQDYIGLYMKDPIFACFFLSLYFLSIKGFPPPVGFFFLPKSSIYSGVDYKYAYICCFNRTLYKHFFYIYYRGFPLRSNNFIKLSMIASTIPIISMSLVIEIG